MNIVLIGYRGTGKTTVGRLVAEQLHWPLIDADVELERRAGRTIREIFATDGETTFRDLETQVLSDLLQAEGQVLSLGGGVVLRPENREQIRAANHRVVWLQATVEAIYTRIHGDPTTAERRPALTASGGYEEIVQLLAAREPLYSECAEFIVATAGKTAEQVAAEVVSLVMA